MIGQKQAVSAHCVARRLAVTCEGSRTLTLYRFRVNRVKGAQGVHGHLGMGTNGAVDVISAGSSYLIKEFSRFGGSIELYLKLVRSTKYVVRGNLLALTLCGLD
jgi:hypothetical protein